MKKIIFACLLYSLLIPTTSKGLTANFGTISSTNGYANLSVAFKDSTVGGHLKRWKWFFDNLNPGDTSTLQNPTFVYQYSGTYNVKLVVYDSLGNVDSITRTAFITVRPQAKFIGSVTSGKANLSVTFTNQSTGGTYTSGVYFKRWKWDFGTGRVGDTSNLLNATFTYNYSGTYSVKLKLWDSLGNVDSIIKTNYITVYPSAAFTPTPAQGCGNALHPLTVTFWDYTKGGHLWKWHWVGDTTIAGDTTDKVGSATPYPIFNYTAVGTYTAKLVVYDSLGNRDSIYKTITVTPQPNVNFYTPDTMHLCAPHTVTFTNTSDTTAGCNLTFTWYIDTATKVTHHLNQTVSYTFTQPGDYNIALTETESCNCGPKNTIKSAYIHVDSFSTPCFTTNDTAGCYPPFTSHFNNCSSSNAVSFLWQFGDGTTDTALNPAHIYSATNTTGYNDTLTSFTLGGCATTLVKSHFVKVGRFYPGYKSYLLGTSSSILDSIICPGNTLDFLDTTNGSTNHHWRFSTVISDTFNTVATTVAHTFITAGVYLVSDSAWNNNCSAVSTHVINVDPNPIVDSFTSAHAFRCTPNDTVFIKSWIRDTAAYSIVWHFGEPSLGILDTAYSDSIHIYSHFGMYSPSIKVTDVHGCTSSKTDTNFININNPFAAIKAYPDSGCVGMTVYFSDTISQTGIPLVAGKQYYLDSVAYSDGTSTDTGINISGYHQYNTVGRFWMYHYFHLDTSVGGCAGYKDSILISAGNTPTLQRLTHAINPYPDSTCPQVPVRFCDSCYNCNSVTWNIAGTVYHFMDSSVFFTTYGAKYVTYIPNYFGCTDTIKGDSVFVWPPNVGFAVSIPQCGNRDSFLFTNTSAAILGGTSYIYHYKWNFGDGTPTVLTTANTISHKYTADGTYTVTLVDSSISPNYHSCANVVTQTVYVYPVVRSDTGITCSKTFNCKNNTIVFRGYYTQYNTLYSNYLWKFGDGISSVPTGLADTTIHAYTTTGIFSPKLILTNKYGCFDSTTRVNYDTIEAPIRGLLVNSSSTTPTVPVTGCAYFSGAFHDSAAASYYTTITKRRWQFNTNPIVTGTNTPTTAVAPGSVLQTRDTTIQFPVGLYHVVVIDSDNFGCFITDTVQINSVKPHAYFTSNDTIACSHVAIHFHDTTTHVSKNWMFGDNSGIITSSGTDTSHIYSVNGTYNDTLVTISNGTGSLPFGCRDTLVRPLYVSIGNSSVHAGFNFSGISFASCPPLVIHTVNTSTSTSTNSYMWRYGIDSLVSSTSTNPIFTYDYPGTYTVTLIDSNALGCKDTTRNVVSIGGPTGTLSIIKDTLCINNFAQLHLASSILLPGVDTPFIWNLGTGSSISTDTSGIIYTYSVSGTFHPYVIIKEVSSGCLVTVYANDSIRIYPKPVLILPTDSICLGSSIAMTATGANTYVWSPSYGLSTTAGPSSTASPTTTTTYKVIGTTTHTCKDSAYTTLVVKPTPTLISGPNFVCSGSTINYTNGTSGGAWTSRNTLVATINSSGIITGISPGTDTITYSIGNCFATKVVSVYSQPLPITGDSTVCNFNTDTVYEATTGGTWSSSNTSIVSISSAGIYTAHAVGTATISYSISSCFATRQVTVNSQPDTISGINPICNYASTTFIDDTASGNWSSANPAVATVSNTGVVTGASIGSTQITYSVGSCYSTKIISVNNQPDTISGSSVLCNLQPSSLSNDTTGGTWSSSNTSVATVNSFGVVTGLTPGTLTITYSKGSCYSTLPITMNPKPSSIIGISSVCASGENTITLTDDSLGGKWSSGNITTASIDSVTGILSGINSGLVSITYTLPTGCYTTGNVTVKPLPSAITGTPYVCESFEGNTTLHNTTAGGTWSSGNISLATVGSATGIVTGIAAGFTTITYTGSNACYQFYPITINPKPDTIAGIAMMCEAAEGNITLTNDSTGGTWSSNNVGLATINSSTGVVTGVAAGHPVITYTNSNGCYQTKTVTVNARPAVITGTFSTCENGEGTVTLNDASAGGTWSSSDTTLATINSSTGAVTGVAAGNVIITYSNSNGCYRTNAFTVNPVPSTISGSLVVCELGEGTTTLVDISTGGTWSSSSLAHASVGATTGIVTGVSAGNANISYTNSFGCYQFAVLTVNPRPANITGSSVVCEGGERITTLSDISTGGTWASNNISIVTIDPILGILSGVSSGITTISYTNGLGCYQTRTVTVNAKPAIITGTAVVCEASEGSVTLFDITTGGSWSSNNTTVATIGSTTGVVAGVVAGNAVITYTGANSCYQTKTITVNARPDTISGTAIICEAGEGNITLTDDSIGGTWTSNNTLLATIISSTGVVTGVSAGLAVITYTNTHNCYQTKTLTVNARPAVITGNVSVCENAEGFDTLYDATTGGIWTSSSTANATINPTTGVVTGLSSGNAVMSYTNAHGCYRTISLTVNPTPANIGGTLSICESGEGTTTLNDATTGGGWSSSSSAIATIGNSSGIVTGVSAGNCTISYSNSFGCYKVASLTVNPRPATITGNINVCESSEGVSTLSDITASGTWASNNLTIATIGATSGVLTGISAGNTTISYTNGNGCYRTVTVTVNPKPAIITGTAIICEASEGTTTLYDATTGGTWTSNNTALATIGLSTGIVTGISAGNPVLTYTGVNSCYQTAILTVNPRPGAILGTAVVCELSEGTASLTNDSTGGTWSSGNISMATIGATTGILTGMAHGNLYVTYTNTNGCYTTQNVTVNALPANITGVTKTCENLEGSTILHDDTIGGKWKVNNSLLATIDSFAGTVIGISRGIAQITYTDAHGCYQTTPFTINPTPGMIAGINSICEHHEGITTLTNDSLGGKWKSSISTVASIDSVSGILTGLNHGTSTISYTNQYGCYNIFPITVNAVPSLITGVSSICESSEGTLTLSDSTIGGKWTINDTSKAVIDSISGIVTGVFHGTSTISYTIVHGCYQVTPIFINPKPSTISGTSSVCSGGEGFLPLTSTTAGGYWTTADTTASVNLASGVVSGITAGSAKITYTLYSTGCYTTKDITVNQTPSPIVGGNIICKGTVRTLSDSMTGGIWSSNSPLVASVDSTGKVSGNALGNAIIYYTIGSCYAKDSVSVMFQPVAITGGASSICNHSNSIFTDISTGGTWSIADTSIAFINTSGNLLAKSVGTTTVSYTVGYCPSIKQITVNLQPDSIAGYAIICSGSTELFTDATPGGTWSSSSPSVVSVNSTGTVTTNSPGIGIVYYSIGSCRSAKVVTANIQPLNIGFVSDTICNHATTLFYDSSTGGMWSSGDTSIAMVNSVGKVFAKGVGTTLISFSIGECYITKSITVKNQPAPITNGAFAICQGQTIHLTDDSLGGNWSSDQIGIASIASGTGILTSHLTGTTTIKYSIGNCFSTIPVTVNIQPAPISGKPLNVCNSIPTSIADLTNGGKWSLMDTTVALIDSNTGILIGKSVGNTVIKYAIGNCFDTTTVRVNIQPVKISGFVDSICVGSSTTFADDSIGGIWKSSDTTAAISSSGVLIGKHAGVTLISYTIGRCSVIEPMTINPLPVITVSDITNCKYQTSNLNASGAATYLWIPSYGLSCTTCSSPIASPTVTTVYTVTGTSVFGCISSATVKDSIDFIQLISYSGKDSICAGSIDTIVVSGYNRYSWSPTTGLDCFNCATIHAKPDSTISYRLVGTDLFGCKDTTFHTVTVIQLASLTSTLTPPIVCTGLPFVYNDTSSIAAATVKWWRNPANGISPSSSNGSDGVSEILINTNHRRDTVPYLYTLTYLGCSDTNYVKAVIDPIPNAPLITEKPATVFCSNTLYQSFGAANGEPAGIEYSWKAVNAKIFAEGADRQYCVVNFYYPGTAIISIYANYIGSGCISSDSAVVQVNSNTSPLQPIVYDNHNFVCLDYSANSFQWGFDDAVSLKSTTLTGEVLQNYYNPTPDFVHKYYWVLTTHGECVQKSYYNDPTGVITVGNAKTPEITVYPNPANDVLTVEINDNTLENLSIRIFDLEGNLVQAEKVKSKTELDISKLKPGFYFISCYSNGINLVSTKFIKSFVIK